VRIDGYLPIADYAVVGDGRTSALVGRDGSVDWLCLPNFDSAPVFDRILDAEHGGCFELHPVEAFEAERRYRDGTNVLETTFRTGSGVVRVTDALTLRDERALAPLRELVRVVDGVEGRIELRWHFAPRFDFGRRETELGRRGEALVATCGGEAVALCAWNAGDGSFVLSAGERATLVLAAASAEPLVLPCRADAERRLEEAAAFWREWSYRAAYDGPWREHVVRSALVLKLLTFAPSGAIVAAPTTSLPEWIGADRNWDYRFGWLRDGIYTMRALLSLGYVDEARAFFWWQMHATRTSAPRVRPLYRIDGGATTSEREEELALPGYRGSAPVRVGNAAADQLQLDVYGHLLESAARFRSQTGSLGAATGRELAELADYVAEHWRDRDAGIWESRGPQRSYVQSKAMCWTALDRAADLAQAGALPDRRARWRAEADAVREWIESDGYDEERDTYVRAPELGAEMDAALLSLPLCAYADATEPRFLATVDAIRRELAAGGPLLYRYTGAAEKEGAFLTCSFWLVDALARAGRREEGEALMAELVEQANDVGLYAEEIDPTTGEHLGNVPLALVHLALVNAAVSLAGGDDA
jgi:GH15 family glucan-1,4-alpha-glucosidase